MRVTSGLLALTLVACAGQPRAPATVGPPQEVRVYFSVKDPVDCGKVQAFPRPVPSEMDPVEVAFTQLLAGPTEPERITGAGSMLGPSTAGMLRSVTVDVDVLVVDLEDLSRVIPNASSSCGSQALLAQLNATAFQFENILEVTYTFNGSCDAFGEFVQMGCVEVNR